MINANIRRPQFSKSTIVVAALKHYAAKKESKVRIAFQGCGPDITFPLQ